MTEAAKEARRAYKREWRRKNKDKESAYIARYWEKKAERDGKEKEARADA